MSDKFEKQLALAKEISKRLVDQGKIIEGGFEMLRMTTFENGTTVLQVDQLRLAFFYGAHHLFASIMSILEEGTDATDNDMRRLDLISKELQNWQIEVQVKASPKG